MLPAPLGLRAMTFLGCPPTFSARASPQRAVLGTRGPDCFGCARPLPLAMAPDLFAPALPQPPVLRRRGLLSSPLCGDHPN